ncbi:MAG TPA: peptide-methionine (S)-S-oxide reductase MsrA [Dehalococcoidia bacterium]|nr:peptide-methionine (S)-S-oxide reductase MsrA [Dehalococcoidia bacterium]
MSVDTSSRKKRPATELETATLAGGCFWCTKAVFKRVRGVEEVTSGYTGGDMEDPSYAQVSTGGTGHAEAVQIRFDPLVVTYESLLDVFWATHDPTTLDRQGADVGSQYRSAIFYHDDEQRRTAEASKGKWEASGKFNDKIVTRVEPFKRFYAAEGYHQDYYAANPHASYCSVVIDPKIRKLLRDFADEVKEEYK